MRLIVAFLLYFSISAVQAETVIEAQGVASPKKDSEKGNIEMLRERALRNAMDQALRQVSGESISTQRRDVHSSRLKVIAKGDDFTEESREESLYREGSYAKSTGYARIVKIVKEWVEGDDYYVLAMIGVEDEKEAASRNKAGFYWERAGKPPISVVFKGIENEEKITPWQSYTLRHLRAKLASNGILVSVDRSDVKGYQVRITQEIDLSEIPEYSTSVANCLLAFQIVDEQTGETMSEHRVREGPKAGFSPEQAARDCIGVTAQAISDTLAMEIAGIMNEKWQRGSEYRISVSGVPGEYAAKVQELVAGAPGVRMSVLDSYRESTLRLRIFFDGANADLVEVLGIAFREGNVEAVPTEIEGNRLAFSWR